MSELAVRVSASLHQLAICKISGATEALWREIWTPKPENIFWLQGKGCGQGKSGGDPEVQEPPGWSHSGAKVILPMSVS